MLPASDSFNMRQRNAFTTPEYPVLYDVIPSGTTGSGVPNDRAGVALALIVKGMPSFLAIHALPEEEVPSLIASLESGEWPGSSEASPASPRPRSSPAT